MEATGATASMTGPDPESVTIQAVPSLMDLEFERLQRVLVADGVSPVHALPLWQALYHGGISQSPVGAWWDHPDFPPPLRRWARSAIGEARRFGLDQPGQVGDIASRDGRTHKYLLRLRDGREIETVRMGYPGRFTACLSTQSGCAMGCVFCATGQGGFGRHLRPGEMVAQVVHVRRAMVTQGLSGLRNLVLMGMGEPLHNYDSVMSALRILTDTRGLNLGPRRITLSTVGVVPGILRLAREPQPFNLAVSLHAANQAERARWVPAAQRWPLDELMAACREYVVITGRRILFEWTLIADRNDRPDQARELAALLHGLETQAQINLIPLNPTAGYAGAPTAGWAAGAFRDILKAAGFPVTVRQRRGIDVAAGCGQLAGGCGVDTSSGSEGVVGRAR